jgi:outer membrane protein assembly factor BamB
VGSTYHADAMPFPAIRVGSSILAAVALLAAPVGRTAALGQEVAPVTVADSPLAFQLLQQALDQAKDNPGEAARIAQKLLSEFGDRVVPASAVGRGGGAAEEEGVDRLEGVVERVERFLRMHPATLERYRQIEGPEGERLLAAGELDEVARTRALTRAGLAATLRLAESDLRSARFAHATARLRRIEGHPDLARDGDAAVAYWFVRGAAAAYRGDRSERDLADVRLQDLGRAQESAERAAIARFAELSPRETPRIIEAIGRGEPPDSDEGDWQPVWTEPLANTPYGRLFLIADQIGRTPLPRTVDRARFDGMFLVVAPSVVGDLVVVFDGETVRALDRLSHRTLWTRTVDAGQFTPDGGPISDLAAVGVGDGLAVVFPGYGFVTERGTPARVVAIEVEDGSVRWETPLVGLGGEEFVDLFPIGAPVVADGVVYLVARKLTSRLETVEYVLALDARTGSLRWATYIAGAGGVNMQGLRPASHLVVADGSVWIASSAGAIARLDATDGRPQWIVRFLVPIQAARFASEPWEMGGPLLVGDRLFAVAPDQSSVVVLEQATGRAVRSLPIGTTATWGLPRYLLGDDGEDERAARIFAIGSDIVAFDPDRLDEPLWRFSEVNAEAIRARQGLTNRTGIRGRVQLAGDHLVVGGIEDVLFVRRTDGRIDERIEIDGPANPILVGPQLLLGQNTGLTALMPAASAERLMRDRIRREPLDPEGGLALLDLGLRSQKLALALEAAEFARRAIDGEEASATTERAREELVVRLLKAAELDEARGEAGGDVHRLLDEVARQPLQLVRRLIARADWLAGRERFDEAIAALDEIVVRDELAGVVVARDDGAAIPAALEALGRMLDLGARATGAMSGREQAAAARLADARTAGATVEAARILRAITLAAPATAAGADAGVLAAQAFEAAGDPVLAWATLQSALRRVAPSSALDEPTARLAVAAIELARRNGWTNAAAQVAASILAERGDHDLPLGGGPRRLSELALRTVPPTPDIGGVPGEALEVPARLARWAAFAFASASDPVPGLLMVDGTDLSLRSDVDVRPLWTTRLVDRDPAILAVGRRGDVPAVLVWQEPSSADATAAWISLADGSVLDATPAMRSVLSPEALLEAGRPPNQQMPSDAPFIASQVVPLVLGGRLVVVRRNGDVAAFDLNDLTATAWRIDRVLDQIYEIATTEWGIALGGRAKGTNPDEALVGGPPSVVVLEGRNGRVLTREELADEDDVRWLSLFDTGEVAVGARSAVAVFDAIGGGDGGRAPLRWRHAGIEVNDSLGGVRIGRTLLLSTSLGMQTTLVALDLASARIEPQRFRAPPRLDGGRGDLRGITRHVDGLRDTWIMRSRDRVVAFDADGAVVGEDAVADDGRDFAGILPIKDGVVVVSNGVPRQMPSIDGGAMRFEYSYFLYRLSVVDGLRLLGPAIKVRTIGQRAERWTIIDGRVVVSTNTSTLVVPVPAAAARP